MHERSNNTNHCGNMQAKLITPRTKNFYIRHKFKQNIYNKVRYTFK